MTMRIGIDAKWFFSGHPSGRVFTRNLLKYLVSDFQNHSFVFFLKSEDRSYPFPYVSQNVQLCYGSMGSNLVSNFLLMPHLVKKYNVDLFVSQNFSIPLRGTKQLCVIFDVIFDTNPEFFTLRERAYFGFIRPLLFFANAIITISDQSKKDLERFGYANGKRKANVVYLGVDERFYMTHEVSWEGLREFGSRWGLPRDFVLYVGRFNSRKNIEGLIRAYSRLDRSRWKLVLCGRADGRGTEVQRLIAELGLEQYVKIVDHIPDDDLPLLYRSAAAFAYFSFKEGFGLPPLEAMASGTPVVVSDSPSLREVCGTAVEYVDPTSVDDMHRGLETVLSSETRREQMSSEGYVQAAKLTWKNSIEQFMRVVERTGDHQ